VRNLIRLHRMFRKIGFGLLSASFLLAVILVPLVGAEVRDVMILNFDPALNGGVPSLLVEPPPGETSMSAARVRLIAYALEETEIPLATCTVKPDERLHFVLPHRGRDDILGVRVEKEQEGQWQAVAEWRALYRPNRGVLDYKGSDRLRRPEDFDRYWQEAKARLAAVTMAARIEPVPERATATGELYRVQLVSYDEVPIVCWYYVPREVDLEAPQPAPLRYPAIQIMPGWGAEEPPIDRTAQGFITLSLNPRAHGPSKEFFTTPIGHHLWNIERAEDYYYRAAYMDCLRGLDFLSSRPEVDSGRIGVEGGSQGGAFALASAALDGRVACAVANVPYLSNFPDFVRLGTLGSGTEFGRLMNETERGEAVRRTLAYVDVSNLAPFIRCPTMVCVGLQDRVCPPLNGITALNRLPEGVPRRLVLDPAADHEVSPLMREANREWFETYLK